MGCSLSFDIASKIARPAARGALGVVVVRLGIAEIGHHAVAKVLGDMSAKALDGLRRRTMVLADDLPPLFRIEMAGDLGRADEIAEKHRQMTALAAYRIVWFSDRTNRRGVEERLCALRAEPGFGGILKSALLTSILERRRTLNAEFRALQVFR